MLGSVHELAYRKHKTFYEIFLIAIYVGANKIIINVFEMGQHRKLSMFKGSPKPIGHLSSSRMNS